MPRNYRLPKEQRNPKGLGRILRQDVLYLIIVNLPSDEEIVTARETLARMQKQHGYGAQAYGAQNWGSHHGFQ